MALASVCGGPSLFRAENGRVRRHPFRCRCAAAVLPCRAFRKKRFADIRQFPRFPFPEPPRILLFSQTPGEFDHVFRECGVFPVENTDPGECRWLRGEAALWLEAPFGWDAAADPGRRAFLRRLREARLDGILLSLDADRLLAPEADAPGGAFDAMRRHMNALREFCGGLSVFILVNRLDSLYGMRSLVARLDEDDLSRPLGDFRRALSERPDDFCRRILAESGEALETPSCGTGVDFAFAAAIQAPLELARLAVPLRIFCRRFFSDEKNGARLRGMFLGASQSAGDTVPSLLPAISSLRLPSEPATAAPSWFLERLFQKDIPAAVFRRRARPSGRGNPILPFGAVGMLAGSVALCWLLTCSFLEARHVLLSVTGSAPVSGSAESIASSFTLTTRTQARNRNWRLPRLGMNEPEFLEDELRRRFADGYFDLRIIPVMEAVQDAALAAARSDNAERIGNALLMLTLTRHGIARALDMRDGADPNDFLLALADSLRLVTPEEAEWAKAHLAWSENRNWMPAAHAALVEFERHIIDCAASGSLSWLPEWINSLPGLRPIDLSEVWRPVALPADHSAMTRIDAAWTLEGYSIAKGLLDAVAYDQNNGEAWRTRRETYLAAYRRRAVDAWQRAAEGLWTDFRENIRDADIRTLIRNAGRHDDPASRLIALMRDALLPMHAENEPDPDILWLRLRTGLEEAREKNDAGLAARMIGAVRRLSSDDAIGMAARNWGLAHGDRRLEALENWDEFDAFLRRAALQSEVPAANFEEVRNHFINGNSKADLSPVANDAPLARSAAAAAALHAFLREESGSAAWDGLSPLAAHDYLRYLVMRRAALALDDLWRETVYKPYRLARGTPLERMQRLTNPGGLLEGFLTGPASGFWRWENGEMVNATWNRLPFVFDPSFLAMCTHSANRGFPSPEREIALPLRVEALHVDREARERPVRAEITLTAGGGIQRLAFLNYPVAQTFLWRPEWEDDMHMEIRIVFPSFTASRRFEGKRGFHDFLTVLTASPTVFKAESFPQAALLRRLGVSVITLAASLENTDTAFQRLTAEDPVPPRSIIVQAADSVPSGVPSPSLFANGPY